MTRQAYSISEFCYEHSVGRSFVYGQFKAGLLNYRKAGKRTIITHEDAKAWLEQLPQGETNATM